MKINKFNSIIGIINCVRYYYPKFRFVQKQISDNGYVLLIFSKPFDIERKAFLSNVFDKRCFFKIFDGDYYGFIKVRLY